MDYIGLHRIGDHIRPENLHPGQYSNMVVDCPTYLHFDFHIKYIKDIVGQCANHVDNLQFLQYLFQVLPHEAPCALSKDG